MPLVLEYEEVLLRQRQQLGLTQQDIADLIDAICALAIQHKIHFLWRPYLRDARDEHVLELAVAARCDYIVTYNERNFIGAEHFGISPITARAFLQKIGEIK